MSSEYDANRSPLRSGGAAGVTIDTPDSLDPNNSIIGKVKSRVSSILPNSFSKWFSPSAKSALQHNEAVNGSIEGSIGNARRRRRIEIEAEDDDEEDEEEIIELEDEDDDEVGNNQQLRGEYDENSPRSAVQKHGKTTLADNSEDDDDDDDGDNDEDNDSMQHAAVTQAPAAASARRSIKSSSGGVSLPPAKRSRFDLDDSSLRGSPLIRRQPLVASTPAVGSNLRSSMTHPPTATQRRAPILYTHMNLYGNQAKKESAYNFFEALGTDISSRRSLNIPALSTSSTAEQRYANCTAGVKRASQSNRKPDILTGCNSLIGTKSSTQACRSSTTIHELDEQRFLDEQNNEEYNQNGQAFGKRLKLVNGGHMSAQDEIIDDETAEQRRCSSEVINRAGAGDSASECSEGVAPNCTDSAGNQRRNTGLFNMSAANSRSGSRTSSFGNGLNFYSHLEGRKSLFAGAEAARANAAQMAAMNNSTMSLTSLNRRQFNASIYGSTSALSDSRLLNTFSPFYQGKTTYGGAAAYNKYASGVGAGASAVRITPTLIRPNSSLSTLSSSSNSLAGSRADNMGAASSAISSTAKRILDLINDFATPLSEAKKMANSLKTSQQLSQAPSNRLTDADLQTSRAMRLSQVRTPYMRPSLTLQSSNGKSANVLLPPVRELQVPSMSQLLQMKKMQSTTERSRQTARANSGLIANSTESFGTSAAAAEYTLPVVVDSGNGDGKSIDAQQPNAAKLQQKQHTNKIKNKISGSARITGSKAYDEGALDDLAPTAVNLPNIAFPLMQSVPKIDISLPVNKSAPTLEKPLPKPAAKPSESAMFHTCIMYTKASDVPASKPFGDSKSAGSFSTCKAENTPTVLKTNFKFSAPLQLNCTSTPTQQIVPVNGNYKFSPPTLLQSGIDDNSNSTGSQLKSGSVLDALKKTQTVPLQIGSFGDKFKKAASEWECEMCLIRNKQESSKCVACETPKKGTSTAAGNAQLSALAPNAAATNMQFGSGFGQQFKKAATEWECDACMLRNKQDATKCVACETPKKGAASSSSKAPALLPTTSSFGDTFKPKAGNWECGTCMISNKSDALECVACQTKKPGASTSTSSSSITNASSSTSSFQFGFAAAGTSSSSYSMGSNSSATPSSDSSFKNLAAQQKAAKWECEACMTRNDAARSKCVCCEQPKPGSQVVSDDVPKFSFGATAAAKFTFGFGGNAPKEEELRKKNDTVATPKPEASKTETPKPSTGFVFGAVNTISSSSGSNVNSNTTANKDTTDAAAKPLTTGFTFGTPKSSASTSAAATSTTGFSFGVNTAAAASSAKTETTASSSATVSSSTSSLSPAAKKPTFSFGSPASSTASNPANAAPSSGGFSFGLSAPAAAAAATSSANTAAAADSKATNPTVLGNFAFKSPTAAAASSNDAAAKPTSSSSGFSFGLTATTSANSSSTSSAATVANNSTATDSKVSTSSTAISSFVFKSPTTPSTSSNATAPAAAAQPSFTFGSSGNAAPTFGSSNAATSSTSTGSSAIFGSTSMSNATPTFGSFGSANASTANAFAATGASSVAAETNKADNKTLFGSSQPTAATSSSTTAAAPFTFGSSAQLNSNSSATTTATNSSTTAWPKNSFVFGSSPAPVAGGAASSTTIPTAAAAVAPTETKSVFGSFGGSTLTPAPAAAPVFGSLGATVTPTFGASTGTPSTTSIFGSSNAVATPSTNLFGSVSSSATNSAAPPAFGAATFGASTTNVPTFGNAAAASVATPSFGGFGASNTNTDGASAAKKADNAPFNFGSTATQGTSGGFNFGSAATAKPSFNFGSGAGQASFNFTGSSSTAESTTKPFQFGAMPPATVFSFGAGAAEATPNAPFQFNAGASPATNNIFAPQPTPGAQVPAQPRRKFRSATRRLTQR